MKDGILIYLDILRVSIIRIRFGMKKLKSTFNGFSPTPPSQMAHWIEEILTGLQMASSMLVITASINTC
jgi:hypothetical protein